MWGTALASSKGRLLNHAAGSGGREGRSSIASSVLDLSAVTASKGTQVEPAVSYGCLM